MTILETFVVNYPFWVYVILFASMFIDGEAPFFTVAIFALQGHLSWVLVLAATFIGVIIGDIFWYGVGKYSRATKLGFFFSEKMSVYHQWLEENFLNRYEKMAFYSKFIYYVNRIVPLIAGWHGLEIKRFIRIHTYAALVWLSVMSLLSSLLGFIIGNDGLRLLLRNIEWVFIGSLVLFLLIEYSFKRVFIKKISRTLGK